MLLEQNCPKQTQHKITEKVIDCLAVLSQFRGFLRFQPEEAYLKYEQ